MTEVTSENGTIEGLIDGFLSSVDVSENTVRTYREALRKFFGWADSRDKLKLEEIEKADIREYKDWLKDHRAANTVSTYIVALRRFFDYCVSEGLLIQNPAQGVKGARKPQGHLRQDLSRAEIRALFAAIDRSTAVGKRDFAIVNLMVRNGLRIIELQRANIGDLETRQGRKILRIRGKGRDEKDEFTVLAEPAEEALRDYLAARGNPKDGEPLFVGVGGRNKGRRLTRWTIRQRVTKYMVKAGVKRERVTPHSLRHSFITLAIEGGATLEEAQIVARHRSIETTRRYFHEHDRLERPVEDRIRI